MLIALHIFESYCTNYFNTNTYIMGKKNILGNNSYTLHKNKDGWGTDPGDGKEIGEILRAMGEMIATIIGAKKQ